ncbi:GntR family transcriptional regulator [Bifidobacterium goeldii]|uniref:GntR family transcriptional regulator n=1 Tax=Bifidobacterium goeldii TaxID=2306975 RepID=A0A430FHK8_9BIFI|nr:GntR family transcriptional regulator [Bifidobacterium goeldii]RSX52178.1 GntR family transcriptional regulator [Bifidobacterium goeldii]
MAEGVPKYVAVRDNLRQRALAMQTGEQLPAEPELCDQYGVSRITLRHAVDDLIQDGLLVREQGRGTFRTDVDGESEHEVISDHIRGFFRQQADLGNIVDTKVMSNTIVRDARAAKHLDLPADTDLIRLERLRYVDNALKQHVVTFLPASRFPKVLEQDFSHQSLYELLEREYAVRLIENDAAVRVRALDTRMAWYFGVQDGTPVLEMDSTVYDEFGATIAFGTTLHSPDSSEITFIVRAQKDSMTV